MHLHKDAGSNALNSKVDLPIYLTLQLLMTVNFNSKSLITGLIYFSLLPALARIHTFYKSISRQIDTNLHINILICARTMPNRWFSA